MRCFFFLRRQWLMQSMFRMREKRAIRYDCIPWDNLGTRTTHASVETREKYWKTSSRNEQERRARRKEREITSVLFTVRLSQSIFFPKLKLLMWRFTQSAFFVLVVYNRRSQWYPTPISKAHLLRRWILLYHLFAGSSHNTRRSKVSCHRHHRSVWTGLRPLVLLWEG